MTEAPCMETRRVNTAALLDTPAAAAYLGLKPATLCNWRTLGKGPVFARLGGAIRYRAADLEAWLAARCFRSTSEADHRVAA